MKNAWNIIEQGSLADEGQLLRNLVAQAGLDASARARICAHAAQIVRDIRTSAKPALMEVFLAEYGLSTREGIALMCLAEALLRVPDATTMDALIEDKIAPSDWGRHLGQSASSLVNASTWALMLTGRVLDDDGTGLAAHLKGAVKRLGEPVIRAAVARAMREMGRAFVLGETMEAALTRAREAEAQGNTYSYDMLGEAARTEGDARRYHLAYSAAITSIAARAASNDIRSNPGISVKLSALHPRYEVAQEGRVMRELVPRLAALAGLARAAGIGLNVDAEEADRLALSLRVIGAVLADPAEVLRAAVAKAQRGAGGLVQLGEMAATMPCMMRIDAIGRALENMLGNAQRYGTTVLASLQVSADSLRFVIEDNGPGIPADLRNRAAEPFARLDAARNPNQGGGVGLGLAITADVARSHGGALTLTDSKALGGLRAELRIAR